MPTFTINTPSAPLTVWGQINDISSTLVSTISERYIEFRITDEVLVFTDKGEIPVWELMEAAKVRGEILFLQKSLFIRRGDALGASILLTWDSTNPKVLSLTVAQSIPHIIWINSKNKFIYGIPIVALGTLGLIYLAAHTTDTDRLRLNLPDEGRANLVMVFLIAVVPGALLGYIIKSILRLYWIPVRVRNEADRLVNDLVEIVLRASATTGYGDPVKLSG